MNAAMLLKNKNMVAYLYDTNTLRQGLEKLRAHGYTAIPVISEDGRYIGSVSEGDFLWHIIANKDGDIRSQEQYMIRDIIRYGYNPAVRINVPMHELLERSMNQNFIPVIDDRDMFVGIVTRKDIINTLMKSEHITSGMYARCRMRGYEMKRV